MNMDVGLMPTFFYVLNSIATMKLPLRRTLQRLVILFNNRSAISIIPHNRKLNREVEIRFDILAFNIGRNPFAAAFN